MDYLQRHNGNSSLFRIKIISSFSNHFALKISDSESKTTEMPGIKIFTGSSHPELTGLILDRLGIPPSPAVVKRFPNAETSVELGVSVRDADVFLIQSGSHSMNDHLMELLIMISSCRSASARRITAV